MNRWIGLAWLSACKQDVFTTFYFHWRDLNLVQQLCTENPKRRHSSSAKQSSGGIVSAAVRRKATSFDSTLDQGSNGPELLESSYNAKDKVFVTCSLFVTSRVLLLFVTCSLLQVSFFYYSHLVWAQLCRLSPVNAHAVALKPVMGK